METTAILIKPKQRAKLARLANHEHVSIDEINRRAIDAYDPNPANERKLEQLLNLLIQSANSAIKAAEEAHEETKATINYLRQNKENKNEY